MNYETGSHIDTANTSLRGYLGGYRRVDLTEILGEPEMYNDPGKVDFNWNLEIEDPETGDLHRATIYNYDGDNPDLYEEYRWHIGGYTRHALYLVRMLIEDELLTSSES